MHDYNVIVSTRRVSLVVIIISGTIIYLYDLLSGLCESPMARDRNRLARRLEHLLLDTMSGCCWWTSESAIAAPVVTVRIGNYYACAEGAVSLSVWLLIGLPVPNF